MTTRSWVGAAAAVCLAMLVFALGVATRPLLVPDSAAPPVFTDDEIGFLQDMTTHHEQALLMVARLSPRTDPSVRMLAAQIGDAQRTELGTMLGWLNLAGVLATNPRPMAWMSSTAEHHHQTSTEATEPSAEPVVAMPGMATTAELDALAAAEGDQADVLFLTLMRRHHSGAVVMAKAAAEQLPDGLVKRTARGMFSDQSREAATMTMLLAREPGATP